MRLTKPLVGAAMACLLLSAAGCTTLSGVVGGLTTAAGLTVTRHDAIVVADSIRIVQDADTAAINSCTAAKSFTGPCSETVVTATHNAIVAARKPRSDLLTYADAHADLPAGVGGLYQLATTALSDLQNAAKQMGVTPPSVPTPATGS